tara:strand:- start:7056 stop:8525 length:1470 start_codon:yes stop_codon:yes gene_type:complete
VDATLLAIDAGTTGVTCLRFDADLRVEARAYREFSQGFPVPGHVEHRAEDILAAVDATVTEALAGHVGPIAAVGITNQRETVFAVDVVRDQVLGPGLVWQDRRTAPRCAELKADGHEAEVRRITGLTLDPYFSGTKIEWLLRERSGVRAAADRGHLRFLTVDALIVRHLTGGATVATDFTNASRTLLFDLEARTWSTDMADLLGVPLATLPEVRGSSDDYGMARLPGGRSAPIRGVVGDQQAALFGQGCWTPGTFKNTYGTGCFLLLNTGSERRDVPGLLTTLAADASGAPCYAVEGSVFAGGVVIQWLRDQLGILEAAEDSEALARTVPDSGGVTLVPAFVGLGAPYWDPDARAALLGLTRGTSRAHIARAALEAIALQCTELVALLREGTGLAIDTLQVDGGAARNDLLMQMQADFAGLTIVRPSEVESTARGAAAMAAVGIGLRSDLGSAAGFQAGTTRFEPTLAAEEQAERLADWRTAVGRILTR